MDLFTALPILESRAGPEAVSVMMMSTGSVFAAL